MTVISSKPERRKDIEALGAIAAIGSLDEADFLAAAFTDADAAFAMVPPNYAESNQIAYYRKIGGSYAEAVQKSGVKRIVHLSSYGAHLDKGTGFILGSNAVEGILDELPNVAVTHLRPGYFYYNLYNFINMIKSAGFISANYGGEDKMVMVDPTDIALAAAEELETRADSKQVRYVASDEHSCSETARILGDAIGKPDLQWLTFTDEQMRDGLETNGIPSHIAANLVEMGAATHSGALREDYELNKPAAMGKVKLKDFAKEFAAAFQKA